MKKFVFALSLISLTACGERTVEIGEKTTIEVQEFYDAGTVVKGEIVHAEFEVKNTGDVPLVITDVKVACSCTLASKPEEPIAPGETGVIEASVDTDKTGAGSLNKRISIIANTEPSSTTEVYIKANVKN